MSAPDAIVFDVNETLSDLSPLRERFVAHGMDAHVAATWFACVLRDGFALSTVGQARGFAEIGRSLLETILPTDADTDADTDTEEAIADILGAFTSVSVHPDVVDGIDALAASGHRLATLSNGSASVAERLLADAGLRDRFEAVLSVEDAGLWKPARQAYEYASERLGCRPEGLLLVAVHPWDLHGARHAGQRTAWINRSGAAYPGHFDPADIEVADLGELAARLT